MRFRSVDTDAQWLRASPRMADRRQVPAHGGDLACAGTANPGRKCLGDTRRRRSSNSRRKKILRHGRLNGIAAIDDFIEYKTVIHEVDLTPRA